MTKVLIGLQAVSVACIFVADGAQLDIWESIHLVWLCPQQSLRVGLVTLSILG